MISVFLQNLEAVFSWLITASWQASVLVLLVLLVQWTLRDRLNPRWKHALWLLVVLRLVLPVLPASALSLFQFAPASPPAFTLPVTEPMFAAEPLSPAPDFIPDFPPPANPFSLLTLLALIWLTGSLVLLVLTWQVNRRFGRQIKKSPDIDDPALLKILDDAKNELGIHRQLRLIESAHVQGPAVMGLFHPTLLLPVRARDKFTDADLRFIFLHELAHLKRGDLIIQWLVALLQILHWFNPVLWFAFRRMRADREPATDALVLSRTGEGDKERYGLILIKLLEHFNQRHSLPTLVGILEDKDQFKQRFLLIGRFTRGAYGWSLLGVCLIALLSVACLTKSKAAATTIVSTSPPPTDVTGKNTAVMIRLNLQVVQIDEEDYQAHRAEIDAAVLQGDVQPFLHLKSYHPVMENPLLFKAGEQCVIENVRVLVFPVALGKDSNGKPAPTEYKRRNLGVRFVSVPTFADGKINVAGHLEVTRLSGWISMGDNYQEPIFNEILKAISDVFIPGQTRGYAASAGALVAYSDPAFSFTPGKPPDPSQNSQAARRIFFFLSTQAFHEDGRPMTDQPSENAPVKADTTTTPTEPAGVSGTSITTTLIFKVSGKSVELPEASRSKIIGQMENGLSRSNESSGPYASPITDPDENDSPEQIEATGSFLHAHYPTTNSLPTCLGRIEATDLYLGLAPGQSRIKGGHGGWLCVVTADSKIVFFAGTHPINPDEKDDLLSNPNVLLHLQDLLKTTKTVDPRIETTETTSAATQPAATVSSGAVPQSNSGAPKPPVNFGITLVEVAEKAYESDALAMDAAVQSGNIHYFDHKSDVAWIAPTTSLKLNVGQPGWSSIGEVQSYVDASSIKLHQGKPTVILQAKAVFFGVNTDINWSKDNLTLNSACQVTVPLGYDKLVTGPDIPRADLPGDALKTPRIHVASFEDKGWDMAPGKEHGFWVGQTYGWAKIISGLTTQAGSWDDAIKSESPTRLAVFLTAQPVPISTTGISNPTNTATPVYQTVADTPAAAATVQALSLNQQLLGVVSDGRTDKIGKGDADKVAQLLAQGADPNAKDDRGTPALTWTLNFGKDDAAQLLIQHGADAGAEDTNGENAAWLASFIYYCPGALDLMIKKGVNVTALNKFKNTLFSRMTTAAPAKAGKMNYLNDRAWTDAEFQAYEQRERRIVDLLLGAGLDVNGRSGAQQKTPLMLAVQSGHLPMAMELIAHGADASLKDPAGDTALSLAQFWHPEYVPMLETAIQKSPGASNAGAKSTDSVSPQPEQVRIELKVVEMDDDVYLLNKEKIESGILNDVPGLFTFLNNLEGVSILSTPSVSTRPGTKANIDIVREFPYPIKFDPAERVSTSGATVTIPATPREFATKNVGVSAEITPTINAADSPDPGKIVLNGKFSVTDFDGFTKSNVVGPAGMPSFTTSESLFLEALDNNQEKGIWIPGEHVALQNPTAANFKPDWEKTAPMVKKRYLLFVSASLVK